MYGDLLALTKPRVTLLVLITTVIGFHLGMAGSTDFSLLLHTVVGTALVASGAAAINQVMEQRTRWPHAAHPAASTAVGPAPDRRSPDVRARARRRRARPARAWRQRDGGMVALGTLASYALVYTPLKRRTSLATVIGAVPGALPPMIGWAAATGRLSVEGWVLFAIVFVWQMPHVLAISWMYREDYERAGIRVLPVEEPDGASTSRQTVNYSVFLIPVTLLPTLVGLAGGLYFAGALALGLALLAVAIDFARHRTAPRARRLFHVSLAYLPLLWALMLVDRT